MGVHRRSDFSAALRRVQTDAPNRTRLATCAMSAFPPPGAPKHSYGDLQPPASYKGLKPQHAALLRNATLLLGPGLEGAMKSVHSSIAMVMRRVRRAFVVEALRRNNVTDCDYGAVGGDRGAGHERYVAALASSDFVASPRGNGRANHREWEALHAGAVPLVGCRAVNQTSRCIFFVRSSRFT